MPSIQPFRADLAARLRARRAELQAAMLARVYEVSDPGEVGDPEYVLGLRATVEAAVDYGIAGIEASDDSPAPVPPQLLTQARAAARNAVALDTVLRRYFAGNTLLVSLVIEEATHSSSISKTELEEVLRAEALVFDRLVCAVSGEYALEDEERNKGEGQRRVRLARMLLAGEPVDPAGLRYDLDAWHLGAIASGPGAVEAIKDFASALDRRLLAVRADTATIWAWLGGGRRVSTREALSLAQSCWPRIALALGEPGEGPEGWRLTHRQARAALTVVLRAGPSVACYTDVALLAAALRDEVLADSLRHTYLMPLEVERDGGASLFEVLRAYFSAGRNVSSAASALGISRQTASARLRAVEERIARSLDSCAAELETALRLRDLSLDPAPGRRRTVN